MKFRQVFIKLILIILAINVIFMVSIPNIALAAESWGDFYYRFKKAVDSNNASNLSDNDIRRMIQGPQGFDGIWAPETKKKENLEPLQEFANKTQESRQNSGTWSESWDEFYERFVKEISSGGNEDNLSDEDIWRALQGPTDQELGYSWANMATDSEAMKIISDNSIRIKESRVGSGTWDLDENGNRTGESSDENQATGLDNNEKIEAANKLRKEITDWYYRTNIATYTDLATLEEYADKINRIYSEYGVSIDDMEMQTILADVNARIDDLGGEPNDTYFESQVGSDGLTTEEKKEQEEGKMTGQLGNSNPEASHTVDEIMNEADGFLNTGKEESVPINGENVRVGSGILYNILITIAVVAAEVIGLYLGIKFMMSSAEDRAKVKEALIPYIAGCVVIFASFTIWKLVISILGNVA